jgi:DNA-binding transcriptional LysR family regulator
VDQLLALRVFLRIAESGAFSKAADSMDIPRPTVTKLVQDLEHHLGVRLLQRTTRRVSVTPEGASYYERARRLVDELDDMDERMGTARVQPRGRIRVDVGSILANMILIPALPGFRARHPELHVDLGVSDRPVDLVGEGVDCVIRGGELDDNSLVARHIADLDWVTCASPLYLKARGVPTHPDDLMAREVGSNDPMRLPGHAVVGYFSSLTGRSFPLEFNKEDAHQTVRGQAAVAVNESTAHMSALLAGLGVGQVFRRMAAEHIEEGRLREILSDWTRPRHPLYVVYPNARHLSSKLRLFVDWIVEIFRPFDDRHK